MKHFALTIIITTFACGISDAQSTDQNYIATKKMLNAQGGYIESVQYFDGLGYPTVTAATTGEDGSTAYTLTTYDGKRREERKYLPMVIGTSFDYMSPEDIISASSTFHGDGTAYTQSHYDALDRVTKTDLPGQKWRDNDKANGTEYSANTAEDKVKHYEAPCGVNSLIRAENTAYEFYPAGTLRKVATHDADGKTVTTFTNLFDEKVLERTAAGDTYYVYNDLGQLRYVLTPKYQTEKDKALDGYEYRYDARGRVVKKILPGCEYIQYWYDKADRLLYMQDATLRNKGRYRFMLYDGLGRLCVQGLCSDCKRSSKDGLLPKVTYDNSKTGVCGTGYTLSAEYDGKLLTSPTIEIVNYYDNYGYLTGAASGYFGDGMEPDLTLTNAMYMKGFQTGSIVTTSDGKTMATVQWNDIRGNVLGTKTRRPDGVTETERMSYTFTDKVASHERHIDGLYGETVSMTETNTYSNMTDRLTSTDITLSHGYGDYSKTVSYGYDQLGRLNTVTRPTTGVGGSTVSYAYDMRGWTREISTTEGFSERLFYQDGNIRASYYNGNISKTAWTNSNDPDRTVSYWFTYDKANRMTAGMYYEGGLQTNNKYNEHLTYDANGNICSIHRYGKMQNGYYGYVDDLQMTLTGNRLTGVTEKAKAVTDEGSTDYKGVTGVTTTCTYNDVGSLTSDEGRGIALIEYDYMNNPKRIQFTNGNVTKYIYSATGEKLRTIYQTAVPNITVAMGSKHELTDAEVLYKDSVDYYHGGKLTVKNGRLDKCYFDGGYAQASPVGVAINCKPAFGIFKDLEEEDIFIVDDDGNVIEVETVQPSQSSSQQSSNFPLHDPISKSDEDVFTFHYYTADHLGNIREVINEDGAVEQITNYYPFGTPFAEEAGNTNPDLQTHKYNGKEFDTMHGLNTYDYGARQYNSLLGRWDRMDPLCEKYYSVSPYAYCHNNPVMLTDPNGMDDYYDFQGNYLGTNQEKTDFIYVTKDFNRLEDGRCVVGIDTRVALPDADLGSEAYSKIIGNSLKMMGINMDNFVNNKVQVAVWHYFGGRKITEYYTDDANTSVGDALAITDREQSNGALITVNIFPEGTEERSLISTRANIQSLVGDHEYKGHYINKWQHIDNVPDPTYDFQIQSPIWKKTTQEFKDYINKTIKQHGW